MPIPDTQPTHVQAIVKLTPDALGSAVLAARASGQSFECWLSDAIELSASVGEHGLNAPWDASSMQLFASIASMSPGVLTGKWRTLFDIVAADPSLWRPVPATLGEIEEGLAPCEPPVVDMQRLSHRWAALVATVFLE